MRIGRLWLAALFACSLFVNFSVSYAAEIQSKLVVLSDDVLVLSGPSFGYRPITVANKDRSFPVSNQLVQTPEGDFYKVLVTFKSGQKSIGYISSREKVRLDESSEKEEIENYKPLALAKSSMQAAFYGLRNNRLFWTIGYLKYPAPAFYLKGFIGQFFTQSTSSMIFGGELGTDHFVRGPYSLYTSLGAGFMVVPRDDAVFRGSTSFAYFFQGGTGIRYNTSLAAISFGPVQSLVLDSGNSYLAWGMGITLEVGL
ncbi:MAG: hypothetical protein ABL958_04640 [Bdellovibrionia bacterium]